MNPMIYAGLDNYSRLSFQNRSEVPIFDAVSEITGIPISVIKSRSRKRHIVEARCLACHFLRKYTRFNLPQTGQLIGGRDHSTVIYQLGNFKALYEYDHDFRSLADKVEKRLVGNKEEMLC